MAATGSGIATWLLVVVAAGFAVAFVLRALASIRLIARRPAASIQALRLHDRAAGSLGRAVAVAGYILVASAPSWWGFRWDSSGVGWPLAIAAVVTVFALMLIERRWPVPGGTVREASLQRRRLTEVLPRGGLLIAGVGLLLAVASIVACGLIGRPWSERGVDAASTGSSGSSGSSQGHGWPWPDWEWTAHLWVGTAAIAVAVALAAAVLLRRPALAGFDRSVDLAYRRAGVDRILRVLSCYCFIAASTVVNEVKNVVLGPDYGLGSALNWLSGGLIVAGLVSVELFRTRPPGQARVPVPSVPVATR